MAPLIAGASFVEVDAGDQLWWSDNPDGFLDEVEQLVTGVRRGADPDRVLATVRVPDWISTTAVITSSKVFPVSGASTQ